MDITELARELGRAIQADADYINMRAAEQRSEEDSELSELIDDYNTKRMAINVESAKTQRNEEKIQSLNKDMRSLYAQIMCNENMKAYNEAKRVFETKLQTVMGIIQNSASGGDPDADPMIGGCSGDCSSCGGC